MVAIFTVAIFLSASLLFLVQPMFTRLVLPLLGGSPYVWNTALVFFQAVLLAGYLYAHASVKRLGARRQARLHLILLLLPLAVLPIGVRSLGDPPTGESPVLWLIATMALSIGLPFFALSAGSPLLQRWFATLGHPASGDPYFLYATSNVGSMAALLAYPLWMEWAFPLRRQAWLWSAGYVLMLIAFALAAWLVWRRGGEANLATAGASAPERLERPTLARRVRWVLLAAVPVSLMMGVTTFITTDVASVPLLWAIPLALYLLTFIAAFARRQFLPRRPLAVVAGLLLLLALATLVGPITSPKEFVLGVGLGAFFVASLACHLELAHDRPDPEHLTEFFVAISLGGVIGGLFCGLLAPILFQVLWEYAIALVLGIALMPALVRGQGRGSAVLDGAVAVVAFAVTVIAYRYAEDRGAGTWSMTRIAWTGLAPALLIATVSLLRPVRMAFAAAGMFLGAHFFGQIHRDVIYQHRNFFGAVRVTDDRARQLRYFFHGTTLHGLQALDPERRSMPNGYYHPDGPMGDVFRKRSLPPGASVGIVGLGVGAVAGYARPDQQWTFYEIDPAVVRVATDRRLFTYLPDMAAPYDIVLGDARLMLSRSADRYDLLVLAAYSSDTIPVHLITREAFRIYLDRLAPGGLIATHIGHRYMDLEPVIAGIARDAGLAARLRYDRGDAFAFRGRTASVWVVLAREEADLGPLARDPEWRPLREDPSVPLWTDDYSSIVPLLNVVRQARGRDR